MNIEFISNITNDINELNKLTFENYTLQFIMDAVNNKQPIPQLFYEVKENKVVVYNANDYSKNCLIFFKPVSIKYIIKSSCHTIIESDKIFSTVQIDKKISEHKKKNVSFTYNDNGTKYNYDMNMIYLEKIDVKNITIEINEVVEHIFTSDMTLVNNEEKININNLSLYFKFYFPNYPLENIDIFSGKEREHLIFFLKIFHLDNDLNIFKLCGSSGCGKSTTLLNFSRKHYNIVYFNLKTIMKSLNETNDKKTTFSDIIFQEIKRISVDKYEENKITQFYNELKCESPSQLIYKLIKYFQTKKITFIFDHFTYDNFDSIQYKKIKKIIYNSKLKLILCVKIDNGIIKDKVIKSIKINHGNPKILTKDTQKYYFYFSNLFNSDLLIQLYNINKYNENSLKLYKKFNYNLKYKKRLDDANNKKDELDKISNNIKNKIKKNCSFDSSHILYLLSSKIGKEIKYNKPEELEILYEVPFKYFNLTFKENAFTINYNFPFIQELSKDWPKEQDILEYFQNEKYNDEFYGKFKGEYFEDCVKIYINKWKDKIFPQKIMNCLIVDNIVNMQDIQDENVILSTSNAIESKKLINCEGEKNGLIEIIQNEIDKIKNVKNYNNINYYYKLALEEKLNNKTFIGKKRKTIYKFSEIFQNDGILINQKNRNGETLDEAALIGDKMKKIFLGLQMKFYGENTTIDNEEQKKFSKTSLKNKLKNIIANTKINFDINIAEWHYILILYFHQDNKKNSYSKNLVKICKKNNLEYIFFDPLIESFYNSNFEKLDKIKTTNKSNLDLDININPYLIFKSFCSLDKNIINSNDFEIIDCTNENFTSKINELIKGLPQKSSSVFIRKIINDNKEFQKIKIIGLMKSYTILFPKENYGFFVKSIDNNFLLCYNKKNKINYYNCDNNEYIKQDEFFHKKSDNNLIIIECLYKE